MNLKRVVCAAVLAVLVACIAFCAAEEEHIVYCVADMLNGRVKPNKHSEAIGMLEYGWDVVATGRTEKGWVEVYGSENGVMWCKAEFLTDDMESVGRMKNVSGGRVFVRDWPDGKKVDTVKAGKTVVVKVVRSGWGCIGENRWVDMRFFEEVSD